MGGGTSECGDAGTVEDGRLTMNKDAALGRRSSAYCDSRDTPVGIQYRVRILTMAQKPGPWLTERWYGSEEAAWRAALRCIEYPNQRE